MRPRLALAVVVLSSAVALSCSTQRTPDLAASIRGILDAPRLDGITDTAWTDTQEFYRRRQDVPAWDSSDGRRMQQAVDLLRVAGNHGLDERVYGSDEIARLFDALYGEDHDRTDAGARAANVAMLDVRTTAALLAAGRDVAIGHAPPAIDPRWPVRRQAPDLASSLSTALDGDLAGWFDALRPGHPEYAALQAALTGLRDRQQRGESGLDAQVAQVGLNLDRWRWMPDDLGARHILVNIPSFQLVARDHGQVVESMKVVVGTVNDKTPIFSAPMKTVVFSPYWNLPESIVEGETAPAAARDSSFLARNQIEILKRTKSGTEVVDPSDVDWNDTDSLKALAFRQKPGAGNALGHVKFLFPNEHAVYLHDTPADDLFSRDGRAFSHGCVRVERPEALARWLLRERPEWDDRAIQEAMFAGVEKSVAIAEPVQVHLAYFTAWVDEAGTLQFAKDLYGYDALQMPS